MVTTINHGRAQFTPIRIDIIIRVRMGRIKQTRRMTTVNWVTLGRILVLYSPTSVNFIPAISVWRPLTLGMKRGAGFLTLGRIFTRNQELIFKNNNDVIRNLISVIWVSNNNQNRRPVPHCRSLQQ